MPVDDVADSTDWLSTPLSRLAAVESALRCEVCKDFYRTPMITSCAHTFCSICIRRALSNDSKCPLCRATDQELKLRSNWSMEQTVAAFSEAREDALTFARRASVEKKQPTKRRADDDGGNAQPESHSKRLRTSARLSGRAEVTPPAPSMDVVEDSEDEDFEPDNNDGLVPCPMCQRRMKEWQVFAHLESCPGPDANTSQRKPTSNDAPPPPPTGQMQRRQQTTLERLPSLSYSMFKESALRKKLADMGIAHQGPRPLLERRHREWLTIWNANCDAARPRRRVELLRDLDVWERTQGGKGRAVPAAAAVIKDKAFDGAAWAAAHEGSFQDLIADARRSRRAAQTKTEEAGEAVEEEEAENKARQGGESTDERHREEVPASPVRDTADTDMSTADEEEEKHAAPPSSQANAVLQEQYL
ncbi:DNA repair rad18 [Cordyceps militaris]|uniref:Postreplication repair E3 ubiquitin-protein ligase RAD18 n=1 Tax=Cordyceps militaris TaxID=73501 RepID=A0A2H4STD0_CORMI|nr:DNA repair rad18 [Cordyceps militaris]